MSSSVTIIDIVSNALGDNIAVAPYGDRYQQKHGGKVYVRGPWHNLFVSKNPNVEYVGRNFHVIDAQIVSVPYVFTNTSIQNTTCNLLGLEYEELRPTIKRDQNYSFNKKNKYVCISVQATLQGFNCRLVSLIGLCKLVNFFRRHFQQRRN